jgi:hypothetical protein
VTSGSRGLFEQTDTHDRQDTAIMPVFPGAFKARDAIAYHDPASHFDDPGAYLLTFGKFAGYALDELPDGYLE